MSKGQETTEVASGACAARVWTQIGVQYVDFEVEQYTQNSRVKFVP